VSKNYESLYQYLEVEVSCKNYNPLYTYLEVDNFYVKIINLSIDI
jgi:hypothetical protein